MNDYFAGSLARERQADFMREIAHDELVAKARRARSEGQAPADPGVHLMRPTPGRWRTLLDRFGPARLAVRSHHP